MILFSNKCGQLGNRLFAFAHLIAAAETNGLRVINLSFDEYAKYFATTSNDIFCRYPAGRTLVVAGWLRSSLFLINKALLKILRIANWSNSQFHQIVIADLPEFAFTDNRYFDLGNPEFIKTAGDKSVLFLFGRFFRDYKSLTTHQFLIKKYFTPVLYIRQQVEEFYRRAKDMGETLIGVHIRAGDYREFVNGRYFFSPAEFSLKMIELRESFHDRKLCFVVCSNEEFDMSVFGDLPVLKGPGHLVSDMYLLAQCDYIMGPPSTYTLWASFYGNKPLYQIREMSELVTSDKFLNLPAEILYNFSFN